MKKSIYKIVVGNVGTMEYTNKKLAHDCFVTYRTLSIQGITRVANEDVTMFKDDEILAEHFGVPVMGSFDDNGDF